MKLTERQKKMLELFETRERLKVKELTKLFYVSDMTVRRDLDELEGMGYITRFRGGAVYHGVSENMPIRQRFFVDEEGYAQAVSQFCTDVLNGSPMQQKERLPDYTQR